MKKGGRCHNVAEFVGRLTSASILVGHVFFSAKKSVKGLIKHINFIFEMETTCSIPTTDSTAANQRPRRKRFLLFNSDELEWNNLELCNRKISVSIENYEENGKKLT